VARSNKKSTQKKRKPQRKAAVLSQSARPSKPLIRLIPMTIGMAVCLLTFKSFEIYQSGRAIHEELLVSSVQAEDKPTPPAADDTAEPAAEAGADAAPAPAKAEDDVPRDILADRPDSYNERERDVLESLAERRKKLDQWEKDIKLRDKVLEATEQRIDEKLTELNGMSNELKDIVVTYEEEDDAKISSLVKVYEAMKPKDAARIFEELDMSTLLMVVDRMSERKVAPILAAMSPQKAMEVTQQLADQQKREPIVIPQDGAGGPPLM